MQQVLLRLRIRARVLAFAKRHENQNVMNGYAEFLS